LIKKKIKIVICNKVFYKEITYLIKFISILFLDIQHILLCNSLFKSVVVVTFQSHLKIYQNDIFYFKKLFLILAHQNNPKILKKIKFK
jgi:hypothetical protein